MAEFKLPLPDTHCFDDDTQKDVWSYSTDLVQEILRAAMDQPALAQQPAVPPDWRELCRRLYVELFHVDQQLCSILDDEGEPICTQGSTVRNVLADAKAALNAAPEAPSQTEKKLSINDCYYCNFSGFSHCSRPDVAQAIQLAGGKPGSRCSNREVYGDRAHPIDDGDVTGFAGLLPETGWDEAPAAQKEQP